MAEVPEFHQQGSLSIENITEVLEMLHTASKAEVQVDVGLQVSAEGRIWVCVNGVALLRFKPGMKQIHIPSPEQLAWEARRQAQLEGWNQRGGTG